MEMHKMYRKRSLYVFAFICCATFVLNYTVIRNLGLDGFTIVVKTKETVLMSVRTPVIISESTMQIISYRRNRSATSQNTFFTGSSNSAVTDLDPPVPSALLLDNNNVMIKLNESESDPPGSDGMSSRVFRGGGERGSESFGDNETAKSVTGKRVVFQHDKYTVFTNYVSASWTFECNESITYTTHGEFRFMENLVPLAERWEGPISIALYAPGKDFEETDRRIHFLRECTTPLIKQLVTFHVFMDTRFLKDTVVPEPADIFKSPVNCNQIPEFGDDIPSFRKDKNLPYPVNVARNLARRQAQTHFILASDIELYPSVDIIPRFLEMTLREDALTLLNIQKGIQNQPPNPRVYVLPIFEVEETVSIPDTKADLLQLLKGNNAVPFHKYVCPECHKVPKYNNWLKTPYNPDNLNVLVVAKRKRPFQFWEPIYLGTNQEPWYDERLTWEGLRDKMSQGFAMCILSYDFMVLDNAFLVHRPGIKKKRRPKKNTLAIKKQNRLLGTRIMKEITATFGKRRGCYL